MVIITCRSQWQYASIYNSSRQTNIKYRNVYLMLDEGTLTFNSEADVSKGMQYFISNGILKDNPYEIARFLDGTFSLKKAKVRQFLCGRQDVVEYLVSFQNYANTFLPNALRRFFSKLEAPNDRGTYLQVDSRQYCEILVNNKTISNISEALGEIFRKILSM